MNDKGHYQRREGKKRDEEMMMVKMVMEVYMDGQNWVDMFLPLCT